MAIPVVISLLLVVLQAAASKRYPCNYASTVNITDGLRLKDGSYSFEGLIIPANLTAEYNVKVIDGIEYGAERHMRGCICLLKPCITFCCPEGMIFNVKHQNCTLRAASIGAGGGSSIGIGSISNIAAGNGLNGIGEHGNKAKHGGHIEVTQPNGSVEIVSIPNAFVVRYEFGCKHKLVDLTDANFWKWDLYANGSLSRDGQLWTTDEYCFTPLEHKKVWSLTPLTCVRHQRGFRVWIYVICVALAIIINAFMATFLISLRRFRNSGYGESVIFYLICIVIGYTALAYLSLKNPMNLSKTACRSIGFIAYYFLMLSFLLLCLISWELWRKLISRPWHGWRKKLLYLLLVGIAFALKVGLKYAQDSNISENMKPGIGDSVCWFDVRLLGIFYYYYLPMLLLLAFSVFCCSKAYQAIWNLPSDNDDASTVNTNLIKAQFYAFAAYLIGVISISIREIIVWVTARLREHFFIIDFWTGICVLGLAITGCVCFLWKNKVVQSWWQKHVSRKPDDFLGVNPPSYRLRAYNANSNFDKATATDGEKEQMTLK